jgi:hypothetical protein
MTREADDETASAIPLLSMLVIDDCVLADLMLVNDVLGTNALGHRRYAWKVAGRNGEPAMNVEEAPAVPLCECEYSTWYVLSMLLFGTTHPRGMAQFCD